MSDEEIDKAVKEAAQYEAEDKKRKEGVDTRNEADSLVFQVEKALNEVGDKVSGSDKAAVEADLKALKDVLAKVPADASNITDDQINELKSAREKLMNSSNSLFTKMYENMQQNGQQGGQGGPNAGGAGFGGSQGAGPQGGNSSSGNDDNVVDADYKEV